MAIALETTSRLTETTLRHIWVQQGEADDLLELLYKELERTPQHGTQFAKAVRQLMLHEDQWADWKLEGAATFERPARELASRQPPAKRRRISQPKQTNLGTRELTRLPGFFV